MYYYTIQDNNILIAENEQALTRFYDNVLPLPSDYEPNKYIVDNGELVINPNYEEEQAEKERQQFLKDFFNTSLGWVRRAVHMKDGSIKDFLSDILPLIQPGVPIITYNIDGTQNKDVLVTEEFIGECKQQVLIDFYGAQNAV